MFEQTSVLLTIQGPWIDLSPSFQICLPGSSFLKCRVAWISCTPCQTTKPACPNKSTLLWLYSPGMLIHMLLLLGLGAQACWRNWMAANFPAKTIAHTSQKTRKGTDLLCSVLASAWIFCQRIPETSFRYRDPQSPSDAPQQSMPQLKTQSQ